MLSGLQEKELTAFYTYAALVTIGYVLCKVVGDAEGKVEY